MAGRKEASESNRVDWLVLPDRGAAEEVEQRVFQAVLHGMRVEVLYASPHGKTRRWRALMLHALAWSGHRWHARAWCLEKLTYQDFVLGRMEEDPQLAIASEFRMEKRRLKIKVRKAMVQYLETALGLIPADGNPQPPRLERVG